MKYYDGVKCVMYIACNYNKIEEVQLGIKEDWTYTSRYVYSKGRFLIGFEMKVKIAGIEGSIWGTPVMKVTYKDGTNKVIDCYFEIEDEADEYADFMRDCWEHQ